MNETLSALMDAELKAKERERMLDVVMEDVDLQSTWGRYHVARAILRKEWSGDLSADFSTHVLAALASSPEARVIRGERLWWGAFKGRQVAQFALAASLTAVAALFGLRMTAVGEPASIMPVPSLKTAMVAPLSVPQRYIERAHWQGPRWRDRLNAFLLEHSAVAPLAGMNGLSYVRLAAYNGTARGARNKP